MIQPLDAEENLNKDEIGLFCQLIHDNPNIIRTMRDTSKATNEVDVL